MSWELPEIADATTGCAVDPACSIFFRILPYRPALTAVTASKHEDDIISWDTMRKTEEEGRYSSMYDCLL